MNAVMAGQGAAAFNTQQLFGLLLYREQGKREVDIAALVRVTPEALFDALGKAERGELDRVPAFAGTTAAIRPAEIHNVAEGGAGELFLRRWQRVLLRRILDNGGDITVAGAARIRATYGVTAENEMALFRRALKAQGMTLSLAERSGTYRMSYEGLERLRALVANRWRAAQS